MTQPTQGGKRPPELGVIARHAGSVLAGQLAVMAFGVVDTIVAGRHSEVSLAALSVGSAYFISVYVGLMGVLQALLPAWAELHGAGQAGRVGQSVRQALYVCFGSMGFGMWALLCPGPVLHLTGVPVALQEDVRQYLAVLAWSLPAALLFRMYSTLNQSLGKPLLVTWLQVGALVAKLPLSIWFAFGGAGLAAGGAVGCAWATLVVNYATLVTGIWLLRTRPFYLPYQLWKPMEAPDWQQIRQFLRLGVPAGLAIMVEVTSFTLMALFISRMGTVAAASHQVAANLAAVLYMVPLSLGIATSARVSFWLGAGAPDQARAVVRTGFRLAWVCAVVLALTLFAFRGAIASLYAASSEVAGLAAALLAWVALYHLADATQALSVFVLRCYRVTVAPLVVYCVLLWGVGLGGGYLLAYEGVGTLTPMQTPSAFWLAGGGALFATAAVFVVLLWRTASKTRSVQA